MLLENVAYNHSRNTNPQKNREGAQCAPQALISVKYVGPEGVNQRIQICKGIVKFI